MKSREKKIEDIELYNRFTVLENYEICNSDYDLDTNIIKSSQKNYSCEKRHNIFDLIQNKNRLNILANSSENENEEVLEFKYERKIDIENNLSNQMKLEEGCQTLRQFIKSKGYRLTSRSIPYDELNRRKLSLTKNSNKIEKKYKLCGYFR